VTEVLVYKLETPRVRGIERLLVPCLASACGAAAAQTDLHVFPASGCYRWKVDPDGAGQRRGVARDEEQAALRVRRFFEDANSHARKLRKALRVDGAQLPDPFPVDLLQLDTVTAADRRLGPRASWRTSWRPSVATQPPRGSTASPRADTIGGRIDVVLGHDARIRAVHSDFRCWTSAEAVRVQPLPAVSGDAHAHGHGAHDRRSPELIYLFEAPHEPQQVLAPYWRIPNDGHAHTPVLLPACAYAFVPGIAVVGTRKPPDLIASIVGADAMPVQVVPGRQWQLAWSIASLDRFGVDATPARSTQGRIRLPGAGIFHVELAVTHRPTGVTRRTWRQVVVPQREARDATRAVG